MPEHLRSYPLGQAVLTVINVGDSLWNLGDELALPPVARADYPAIFQRRPFPSQCVHIALPGASLLVDASRYTLAPGSGDIPPGYTPPPSLVESLAAIGVAPEDITHVVITHPHWDHINGLAVERGGELLPCFPRARHLLGRADWEQAEMRTALGDPTSLDSRTLGIVDTAGLLELVDGERELTAGVRIVAAPGETPGHQMLRVESEGAVAYCLGDLVHSDTEIEHPDWVPTWADSDVLAASRHALTEAALAERALLAAAHIAGAGRLVLADGGRVRWVAE
jgi:glyoxylase-like metal-dependent hydrolase (beta-lactamase superfamily II)